MSDEVKISASATGVEVASTCGGTRRLVNAIADLGSPFSETAGLIGDLVRTYREEKALAAIERVKQLSREQNKELSPPHPKFLTDWLEGVSLEDDETLAEMWAQLFFAEATESKRSHFLFKRLLRELTVFEASLLRRLSLRANSADHYPFADEAEAHWEAVDAEDGPMSDYEGSIFDEIEVLNFVQVKIERRGIKLECIGLYEYKDSPSTGLSEIFDTGQLRSFLASGEDYDSLEMLEALGLIGRSTKRVFLQSGHGINTRAFVLELHGTYLKPLGYSFLRTVDPRLFGVKSD